MYKTKETSKIYLLVYKLMIIFWLLVFFIFFIVMIQKFYQANYTKKPKFIKASLSFHIWKIYPYIFGLLKDDGIIDRAKTISLSITCCLSSSVHNKANQVQLQLRYKLGVCSDVSLLPTMQSSPSAGHNVRQLTSNGFKLK